MRSHLSSQNWRLAKLSIVNKIAGAALRYRIMAYVTGVVLASAFTWMVVLIITWMVDGYAFADFFSSNDQKPGLYGALWIVHGWAYFLYLIVGVDLAFRLRYSIGRTVLILLAGTIPFMSFVAERNVHKDLAKRAEPTSLS
jgi:integral membrane protein